MRLVTLRQTVLLLCFISLFCCVGGRVAAQTTDSELVLKPYQQQAYEKIMATMDPQSAQLVGPQIKASLAYLSESQTASMLASFLAESEEEQGDPQEQFHDTEATAEDLAYAYKQIAPVLKQTWQAEWDFDQLVSKTLASEYKGETFAVWGHGWREEVNELRLEWPASFQSYQAAFDFVSNSIPTDGRYQFTFEHITTSFNRHKVTEVIRQASAEYNQVGEEFVSKARPFVKQTDELWANPSTGEDSHYSSKISELANQANVKVAEINKRYSGQLQSLAPRGTQDIVTALLMNGKRVN